RDLPRQIAHARSIRGGQKIARGSSRIGVARRNDRRTTICKSRRKIHSSPQYGSGLFLVSFGAKLKGRQIRVEMRDRLDPVEIVFEVDVFVGRVRVLIRQAKS